MDCMGFLCLTAFGTQFDPCTYEQDAELADIKKTRGYTYEDVIDISPDKLPNYDDKVFSALVFCFLFFDFKRCFYWPAQDFLH